MTAMQQLINEIVEHLTYDDDLTEDSRIALETIRLRCLGKLEMEKQQIIDAYNKSFELRDKPYSTADKYYTSTYGSKGSDDHIVDTNEMVSEEDEKTNSQRFDEFMDLVKSSQTEISDEEIEKAFTDASERLSEYKEGLIDGAKWYREQLKLKI